MKLAIVGTRNPGVTYQEWEKLLLDKINPDDVQVIISGGARGIDTYAKIFAEKHGIPCHEFLPEYAVYGKFAPLRRNIQIVNDADIVIAFPSENSRGTRHAIREAEKIRKRVLVHNLWN
ncbi:MAG: DNA-processing protein DprA [Muribaculaceae bacterium]|nr:DNA-processing protein DprA [Muribaculaceae bacterium]